MDERWSDNLSIAGVTIWVKCAEAMRFLRELAVEKPLYLLLGTLILLLWGVEKWLLSVSSWVPLIVAVWAAIQYGSQQRHIAIEDLNRKWKRFALEASPTTPMEHCEWLNKLLIDIWPNYLNPMLKMRFSPIVERRLKHQRPKLIERIELQEFSLGSAPPRFERTHWLIDDTQVSALNKKEKELQTKVAELRKRGQKMMHLNVEWDTHRMSILLQAKLAKPLGTARIVINHLYIKGELQLMPILDGKAILYSFLPVPEVDIGIAFGSGSSQSLPATVLPGVDSWLKKLLSDTLKKTMVEPRRRCLYLPAVNLRKKAVAGIIHVTVVGANQISQSTFKGSPSRGQQSYSATGTSEDLFPTDLQTFVEVQLDQLTRRTDARRGSSPSWDSTFNMVLNNNAGIVNFHLYEYAPGRVKHDYLASCEIKLRYCEDNSTVFWAIGPNSSVIAKQVEFCGQAVEMTVPFEGSTSGEISVRLVLKEWKFSDGSHTFNPSTPENMCGSTGVPVTTGRKIHVTVAEAKNLVRKDKSGKIDPYVKVQYGQVMRRTKTLSDNATPVWDDTFDFEELGDGEYLTLKCYNEQTFGDEYIGSARVNLEGLISGSVKEEWIPLEKVNSGDVKLLIQAVPTDNNEGFKGVPGGSCNGWIELVIVEAKDLIAADMGGTSDPYVRVHYGSLKKQTKVVFKSLNPLWYQTLEFIDDGSPLKLYVKDYNAILAASSIGKCEIEYQLLPRNQTYDKWIPLQGVNKGEIRVLITRRVPDLERRRILDSDSSFKRAQQITSQIKQLLSKLQSLAADGDLEALSAVMGELENLEATQEQHMLQLENERSLLLDKAAELDEEILNSSSFSKPGSSLTHRA